MMKELGKKELKKLQDDLPELPKEPQLHIYQCNDCLNTWESSEEYGICSYCPYCMCGDLSILEPIMKDDD